MTFLADDRAKALLTLSDVFGQNASFDRDVTDLYIQDEETASLGHVVMLSVGYTIRQRGGGMAAGGGPR